MLSRGGTCAIIDPRTMEHLDDVYGDAEVVLEGAILDNLGLMRQLGAVP